VAGWRVLIHMLELLQLLILLRVVISWVASPVSRHPFVELVRTVTDPILRPIQAVLPGTGPIDLSPLVALFLIHILQNVVSGAVY